MINIYRDPMTSEDIQAARKAVSDGQNIEDSIAFKVFQYCPIPIFDVVAGITTHAVSTMFTEDPMDELKNVRGASLRDWSASDSADAYVKKVIAQGRELIAMEVKTLELHLQTTNAAEYAMQVAAEVAKKNISDVFGFSKK